MTTKAAVPNTDSNLITIINAAKALCDEAITSELDANHQATAQGMLKALVLSCSTVDEARAAISGIREHKEKTEKKYKWLSKTQLSKKYAMLTKPLQVICGNWKQKDGSKGDPVSAKKVSGIVSKYGWHRCYAYLNDHYPSGLGAKKGGKQETETDRKDVDKGLPGNSETTVEASTVEPEAAEKAARESINKVLRESPTELGKVVAQAAMSTVYNTLVMAIQTMRQSDDAEMAAIAEVCSAAIDAYRAEKAKREAGDGGKVTITKIRKGKKAADNAATAADAVVASTVAATA